MAAIDITIKNQASKVTFDSKYPATDLIAVLLQYIGTSANAFGRDVQTAGQVFHRSLKVYDGIRERMGKVDNSVEAAPDWESFDSYTSAIPPLEKLLLEFYADTSEDPIRGLLPPSDDVQKAITFIIKWKKDRSMLSKALENLANDTFQKLADDVQKKVLESRHDSRAKDDQTTLQALNSFLQNNPLQEKHILQRGTTLLKDVKTSLSVLIPALQNLPANTASEDVRGISIRAMLLVYIPFALIASRETPRKVKDHLRKTEIWTAMKELLEHVIAHIKGGAPARPPRGNEKVDPSTKAVEELEDLLRKLEVLLLGLSDVLIPLAEEILQLIKLAALIRRPFHGQSAALISVLRHLDEYSSAEGNKNVSTFRSELKDVMQDAITALQAARDAVTDVKTITLDSPAYTTEKSKLAELYSSKIKKCFTDFQIDANFTEWSDKFASGVKTDEDHLKAMRLRLGI